MVRPNQAAGEIICLHWLIDSISTLLLGLIFIFIFQGTDQAVRSIVVEIGAQNRHGWTSLKLMKNQRRIHDCGSLKGATGRRKEDPRLFAERGAGRLETWRSTELWDLSPRTASPVRGRRCPDGWECGLRLPRPRGTLPSPHAFLTSECGNGTDASTGSCASRSQGLHAHHGHGSPPPARSGSLSHGTCDARPADLGNLISATCLTQALAPGPASSPARRAPCGF